MPSEAPRLLLNIEGKNPNVPEHSVVHKESVDSENFCPIRDLGIQNLSFSKIPMPIWRACLRLNIGREKPKYSRTFDGAQR